MIVDSSRGAAVATGTSPRRTSAVGGSRTAPPRIMPTGKSRYWKRVTTPKFPPPPRTAQNRSGCSVSLAISWRPSAVTISTAMSASIVRPCFRTSQPTPPPRVRPAMPTEPVSPKGVARPWAAAASVNSIAVRPGCAQAIRASGSMCRPRMSARSRTMPPSTVPWPARLWPPPRTASSSSLSRAKQIVLETSRASAARTIARGRASTAAWCTWRAASYSSSPGRISRPLRLPPSASRSSGSARRGRRRIVASKGLCSWWGWRGWGVVCDRTYVSAAASTVGVRPVRGPDVRREGHGHPSSDSFSGLPQKTARRSGHSRSNDRHRPRSAARRSTP